MQVVRLSSLGVACLVALGCTRAPSVSSSPLAIVIARGDAGLSVPPDPPVTLDDQLADEAPTRFKQRCRIGAWGPARFALRGAPHSTEPPEPNAPPRGALVVVEERIELVRVVMEERGLRLLVYLRRADLALTPLARTVVSERPSRRQIQLAPPETGVRLAPGVDIFEIRRDESAPTRMRYFGGTIDGVAFQGWLHEDALGGVYVEDNFAPVSNTGLLLEGTSLWSGTPELLARLSDATAGIAPRFVYGVEAIAERGAERLVRVVRPHIEVIGLVPASNFKTKLPEDGEWRHHDGRTFSPSAVRSHTTRRTLPKGAPVFSIPENERIGVALADVTVDVGAPIDAERRAIDVSFGRLRFISIAARETDLRPTQP